MYVKGKAVKAPKALIRNMPCADEIQPRADEIQPSADEIQPSADEIQPSADEIGPGFGPSIRRHSGI